MKRRVVLAAVLLVRLTSLAAVEPPRWLTISALSGANEEAIAADLRWLAGNTIVDSVAYSCTLVPEGEPAADKAALLAPRFRKMHGLLKGSGLKEGVLFQATIGHGWTPGSTTGWPKMVLKDGSSMYKFCPLGTNFLAYVSRQAKGLAAAEPDFFMVDDDTRYITGLDACFCPLHLAEFSRRTGRSWTRETLAKALDEDAALAQKWDAFLLDTMVPLMETIRAAFPKDTPGEFCCCCQDSHHAGRLAAVLAAPGQPPVIRINNALYLNDSLRGFTQRMNQAALQVNDLPADAIVLDEADPCPQNRYSMDATRLVHHIAMMSFEGCRGAKIWITRLGNPYETASGRAYRELFAKKRGWMKAVAELGLKRGGVLIPLPAKMPLARIRNRWMVTWGTSVFGRMGIPYRVGRAEKGDVLALNADVVTCFSDAELRELLSHPCLLDGGAAEELTRRGFSDMIGVNAVRRTGPSVSAEKYDEEPHVYFCGVEWAADLARHDAKAEETSRFLNRPNGSSPETVDIGPGSLRFFNRLGGKIRITAGHIPAGPTLTTFDYYSETRKRELVRILQDLGNGTLSGGVHYPGDAELLLETGTAKDGRFVVVADNCGLDAIDGLPLNLKKVPKAVKALADDGTWDDVDFTKTPDGVRVNVRLETFRPAVLSFEW